MDNSLRPHINFDVLDLYTKLALQQNQMVNFITPLPLSVFVLMLLKSTFSMLVSKLHDLVLLPSMAYVASQPGLFKSIDLEHAQSC